MSEPTIWEDDQLNAAAAHLKSLLQATAHANGTGLKTLLIVAVTDSGGTSVNLDGCACPKCSLDMLKTIAECQAEARMSSAEPASELVH